MWLIVSEMMEETRDVLTHYAGQCVPQTCSELSMVGLKNVRSQGAQRYPSAQRWEVRTILYSVVIKSEWINLAANEALVRSGNIRG